MDPQVAALALALTRSTLASDPLNVQWVRPHRSLRSRKSKHKTLVAVRVYEPGGRELRVPMVKRRILWDSHKVGGYRRFAPGVLAAVRALTATCKLPNLNTCDARLGERLEGREAAEGVGV